ncbi:MAG: FAD-dependent oxidoreductase [Pseudobacteriovorax sp.]|nr:FAD-dependent oxidoreductase [Pseudobacteriovorax sp.]
MGTAYFLNDDYDLTLYEKSDYVGGHTNTVYVEEKKGEIPIDTGFMVYNHVTYPNLIKLFDRLNVPTQKTCMSFSVRDVDANLEYSGTGLNGLFRQRRNVFNVKFIKLLLTINRFNEEAPKDLEDSRFDHISIADYVSYKEFGDEFYHKYLVPMSGSVWSTPPDKMGDFPAKSLLRFFHNHGFLGLNTQHQWYTPKGGSEEYKKLITAGYKEKIKLNQKISAVTIDENGKPNVVLRDGRKEVYDKVVFACHGDQALELIDKPNPLQRDLLSKFKYQYNHVYLHTDSDVMPQRKGVWSSWNYRMDASRGKIQSPTTIYWMNRLQKLATKQNYFVSLNDPGKVKDRHVLREIHYEHPLFDDAAVQAQSKLSQLNESDDPLYFCGAYFRYGFHEDGFSAAVDLSRHLLGREPW